MSDELHDDELDTFEFPAVRRRLFVDALFANGFRNAPAMRAAGFRGSDKSLTARGRRLMLREDVRLDVKARLDKLEADDPRFSGQAILLEMAEVAYLEIEKDSLGNKVRALELLGKNRKLFADKDAIAIDDVNKLMTNMGLVVNQVVSQLVPDAAIVSQINARIRDGWLALRT